MSRTKQIIQSTNLYSKYERLREKAFYLKHKITRFANGKEKNNIIRRD